MFVLKEVFDKFVRKVRCLFCRISDIEEVLAQNGLTTSTTTTSTTTTTTAAPTTTTTTTAPSTTTTTTT